MTLKFFRNRSWSYKSRSFRLRKITWAGKKNRRFYKLKTSWLGSSKTSSEESKRSPGRS